MIQNFVKLVAFILFIIGASAVTSLTTGNCPATYDIAKANVTSDASVQSLVTLIYGGLYSS
jgi:hypothetical protein